MDDGGANKIPFGIHGADCDCGEDHMEENPDVVTIPVGQELQGLMFSALAQTLSAKFLETVHSCAMAGDPFSNQQMIHLMAGLMSGYALGQEAASKLREIYLNQESESPDETDPLGLSRFEDLFINRPGPQDAEN